jgi:hypothetical protein
MHPSSRNASRYVAGFASAMLEGLDGERRNSLWEPPPGFPGSWRDVIWGGSGYDTGIRAHEYLPKSFADSPVDVIISGCIVITFVQLGLS